VVISAAAARAGSRSITRTGAAEKKLEVEFFTAVNIVAVAAPERERHSATFDLFQLYGISAKIFFKKGAQT